MNTKRFIIFSLIITLIWSLDYGLMTSDISESVRFVNHIVAFVLVWNVGYLYWKRYFRWAAIIWGSIYSIVLIGLLVSGICYKLGYLQNQDILLDASNIRLFFTTPAPFIAYYLIIKTGSKQLK